MSGLFNNDEPTVEDLVRFAIPWILAGHSDAAQTKLAALGWMLGVWETKADAARAAGVEPPAMTRTVCEMQEAFELWLAQG